MRYCVCTDQGPGRHEESSRARGRQEGRCAGGSGSAEAGNHEGEIESDHALLGKNLGDVARGDFLREALTKMGCEDRTADILYPRAARRPTIHRLARNYAGVTSAARTGNPTRRATQRLNLGR